MIGGTYEYLTSSLPDLYFKNTEEAKQKVLGLMTKYAPITSKQFNAIETLDYEVQKYLPVSSYNIFHKVNLNNIHEEYFQTNKSIILSEFSRFRRKLLKDIQSWRTSQKGTIHKISNKELLGILKNGTPLEKEVKLMRYQWQKLEDISAGHYSDIEAIFTYKIKLLILLRWWSFDYAKGMATFNKLTGKE